jgi:hypothetical protein
LRNICSKAWLSAVEATNAFFLKKGIKEEELPKIDRGRRYMVFKYADRETRLLYFSLRDSFHIEGYYEGTLNYDEIEKYLDDLNLYIQNIEKLKFSSAQAVLKK